MATEGHVASPTEKRRGGEKIGLCADGPLTVCFWSSLSDCLLAHLCLLFISQFDRRWNPKVHGDALTALTFGAQSLGRWVYCLFDIFLLFRGRLLDMTLSLSRYNISTLNIVTVS